MQTIHRIRHSLTRRKLHPPLGFIHVPKCGGTQLMTEIEAFLRPIQRVHGWDLSQTGAVVPDWTTDAVVQQKGVGGGLYPTTDAVSRTGDMIAGHFAYSSLRSRFPTAKLMTILREPQSRVLSHWFYLRDYTDEVLAEFMNWGPYLALARQPLRVFLTTPSIACLSDNVITRLLLWPHPLIPDGGFIERQSDETLLAEALARLREIDFVDIVENDGMRVRLFAWLAETWGRSLWSKLEQRLNGPARGNANEAGPPLFGERLPMATELSGGTAEFLAFRCRLDAVLWRYVAQGLPNGEDLLARKEAYFDRTCTRYDALLAMG